MMTTKRLLCTAMFLLVLGLEPSGLHAADNFWKTLAKKNSPASSNSAPVSSGAPAISLGESRFIAQGIAGQNAAPQKFSVRNVGGGELNFSVNRTPEWLKLDPPSGSVVGEEAVNVEVLYETARLTPGSYIAKILVQDPAATNSPQSIPVYLTVLPKAVMTMSTSNLNFRVKAGQNSESQMIRLKSTGMGTTSYQISSNADWISWTPKGGMVSANEEAVIMVKVDPSGLAVGTYAANLRLESPEAENDAKIVQVNLSVMSDQTISIDAKTLNVSCYENKNALPQSFNMENNGRAPLKYRIASKPAWVSVKPTTGELSPGQSVSVNVQYETWSFRPGTQAAEIEIIQEGETLTQKIPVELRVLLPPIIGIDIPQIDLNLRAGESLGEMPSFTLSNPGSGKLVYRLTTEASWVSFEPMSGEVAEKARASIRVLIRPESLAPGTYSATILITDPNAANNPQKLPISLAIAAKPKVSVEPSEIELSSDGLTAFPPQDLSVMNHGSEKIEYQIVTESPWVTTTPSEGEIAPGEEAKVRVGLENGGLTAGENHATVSVLAVDEVVQTIPVKVTLGGARISLQPAALSVNLEPGRAPPEAAFQITNRGEKTFSYEIKSDEGWTVTEPSVGKLEPGTSSQVRVTYGTSGFEPGGYQNFLRILDATTKREIKKMPVTLQVGKKSPPKLPETATSSGEETAEDFSPKELGVTDSAGSERIPDAIRGLVLDIGNGPRQDRYVRRENPDRGDEARIEFSREHEIEVKDSLGVATKIQAWNLSAQIFIYSPQARWGGFPGREYAELRRRANDQYQEASPVKGAEESFVLKKTLDAGHGETTESWRFIAMQDGVVVSMEAETGKALLKATGETMDFYPFMEQILKGVEDKTWESIFKKENPKFDLLPAALKPVVVNLGTIESGGIDLRLEKMPGFSQRALGYSTESIRRSEGDPAWRLNVRAIFYSPAKEGRLAAERMIESRFKNPGRGQKGTRISKGDGGIKMAGGDFPGISYNIRVGTAFLELEFQPLNKKIMDPPEGVMDELIQKIRGVEPEELFDSIPNREPNGVAALAVSGPVNETKIKE